MTRTLLCIAMLLAGALLIAIVLASCTTRRPAPWVVEQPLNYAPPAPAPAGPPPPPAAKYPTK